MKRNDDAQRWSLAALTAALAVTAGAAPAAQSGRPADPEFTRLDANRDGYLTHGETRSVRGFDKAFTEADDNRDGKLDAAEFAKAQAIHDRAQTGQYIDDSVITARVKAALLKDSALNSLAVSVETHKGVVVLSGFVDNQSQQRRAAEIAAGVDGVESVRNALVVKS